MIKNIFSVILGLVSIGLFFIPSNLGLDFLIYRGMSLIFASIGIIWSVEGLKSTKNSLNIVGIIVSSIGLIGALYAWVGWIIIGGWMEL